MGKADSTAPSCRSHRLKATETSLSSYRKGADVNIQGGEYGTAIRMASVEYYGKVVELLLSKGADIVTQDGET